MLNSDYVRFTRLKYWFQEAARGIDSGNAAGIQAQ